mmetsp:Transcript_86098/g.233637  ORF Transcript_86098/g.233637 Transcript_86098/m.233637 type:complete len:215 (+) Transcript_86098:495-1139(+)
MQACAIPSEDKHCDREVVHPHTNRHRLRVRRIASPSAEDSLDAGPSRRGPIHRGVEAHDHADHVDPSPQRNIAVHVPILQVGHDEPDQQPDHGRRGQAYNEAEEQDPSVEVRHQKLLLVLSHQASLSLRIGDLRVHGGLLEPLNVASLAGRLLLRAGPSLAASRGIGAMGAPAGAGASCSGFCGTSSEIPTADITRRRRRLDGGGRLCSGWPRR